MADAKITGLTSTASSVGTDVLPVVVDVPTVPITKKITLTNFIASIAAILKIDDLVHGDDNTDLDASTTYHGLMPKRSGNANDYLNGAGSWVVEPFSDGWIQAVLLAGGDATWTYVSATSFTLAGDKTTIYVPGLKLKCTNGTVKYFYVASSTYGAPDTTVNLVPNNDYALAAGAITNNYYSRIERPQGFPEWFSYTPTITGWGASPPTSSFYRFKISGKTCHVAIRQGTATTSTTTTAIITGPIVAATVTNAFWYGFGAGADNSANLTTELLSYISSGSSDINFFKDPSGGVWTASGTKRVSGTILYEIP